MISLSKCKTFHHKTENEFDGIISYLNNKYNANVYNQIIQADSSSVYDGRTKPFAVIDIKNIYNDYVDWLTENIKNSNFTIYFRKHKVKLESYSLLGRIKWEHNHPYHWVLEGTNDLINWEKIDEYNDITNPLSLSKYIHINTTNNDKFYSIFRVTQIGKNTNTQELGFEYCFSFRAIDFYGTICQEKFPKFVTCKSSFFLFSFSFMIFISIYM